MERTIKTVADWQMYNKIDKMAALGWSLIGTRSMGPRNMMLFFERRLC